jgi:hypothetical protein
MTYKARLIGVALAASLAATGSIALGQSGGHMTRGSDQQTSEPQAKTAGHLTRMAEHCNNMMNRMRQ